MSNKLIIINNTTLFNEEIKDFIIEVKDFNIAVDLKENNSDQYYNSLEWLLPPAILYVITKPFIESFLKEAGKDAYQGFKKLFKKLFNGVKTKDFNYFNSSGKIIKGSHLGILIDLEEIGYSIRLYIQPVLIDDVALDKLFEFLSPENRVELLKRTQDFIIQCEFPTKVVYLEYKSNEWVFFDLVQKAKEMRLNKKENF